MPCNELINMHEPMRGASHQARTATKNSILPLQAPSHNAGTLIVFASSLLNNHCERRPAVQT